MRKGHLHTILLCLTAVAIGSVELLAATTQPLFQDMHFRKGFMLGYPHSSKGRAVEAVLNLGEPANTPAWRLCQWGAKYSLAHAKCLKGNHADLYYENAAKGVTVGGKDSPNRDLILELRTDAEYGDNPRKRGQSWPHLLVEQDAGMLYPLDELEKVRFAISLRLLYFTDCMKKPHYDPGLHAAQFQMFFIIKNIDKESSEHGNYFWFGVPFFDSRHDIPPAYMARDSGKSDATRKFIYTVHGKTLGVTPMAAGRWITVEHDLLPHIKAGLKEAVKRGYLKSDNCHDYAIANMNLGWEMPGTFNAAIQVKDLEIMAVLKDSANSQPSL